MPRERLNSIANTRDFLRSLMDPKQTPRVPKEIRRQAYWCLRHYPWDLYLEAKNCFVCEADKEMKDEQRADRKRNTRASR